MDTPVAHGNRLGLIVGSALRHGDVFDEPRRRIELSTEWGACSAIDVGDAVVLGRHGFDTFTPAHRVAHHANVAALCAAGCDRVVALASVGGLRDWPVGTTAVPVDFFAPAVQPSFHDDDRGHSVPGFDLAWRTLVVETWEAVTRTPLAPGGVYAQTRGPRFETPAEVRWLAEHADIVGMTIASECILAREAGLAYACLATVDNLANGVSGAALTFENYEDGVRDNQARLVADIQALVPRLAAVARPGPASSGSA